MPASPEAAIVSLLDAGRPAEAVRACVQALAGRPADGALLNLLGVALHREGRDAEALDVLRSAVALDPGRAACHANLGMVLKARKEFDAARSAYLEALRLDPRAADVHYNLANLLADADQADGAARHFRRALDLRPDFWQARRNLANLLVEIGETEAADRTLAEGSGPREEAARAVLLPIVVNDLDHIEQARARFAERVAALPRRGIRLADPLREIGAGNFYLAYHGENDRPLQEAAARAYLTLCPDLAWTAPHCRAPGSGPPPARPRLGVVSSFLGAHTLGKLYGRVVERLAGEGFETVLFRLHDDGSPPARRLAGAVSRVVDVSGTLAEMRGAIAAAEPDILFYPEAGMSAQTYFLAFSRLAPVQCVTWGHPDTTGIPNMDWFIGAEHMDPPGAEEQYSERLYRLPRLGALFAAPPVPSPKARSDFGLPEDARLYLCAQSLFKLHPDFDGMLAAILRRDPKAVVVLLEGRRRHWGILVRRRFAATLPDVANRVRFLPRLPMDDYLRLHLLADAVLDPPHFGGGNSSYEIFAMGQPIVTLPSAFARGRITYAQYRQMDIAELIAESPDHYVELALRLADDPPWKAGLAAGLAERRAVLYDDPGVVPAYAEFFRLALARAPEEGR